MLIFRIVGIVITLLLLICALTPVLNVLSEALSVKSVIGPAELIVVLGAGINGAQLSDESLRRAVYGIELYKRGLAPLLVFSGPPENHNPDESEAEIRKRLAVQMGIAADRVATLVNVTTTRDEARETSERTHGAGV